jgi:hypothetical protein
MRNTLRCATLVVLVAATLAPAQDAKYSVKTATAEPPKDLSDSIRKLLSPTAVQFRDAKGGLIAELWFRKEVPADATPEQVKNGLTYRELKETTVLGAARFEQAWTDYRKQKIKPGVYSLRLGFQPMDGDHMGTSPYPDFLLLVNAKNDKNADPVEPKALQEMSIKTMGTSHPGVLVLFPNNKAGGAPQLVSQPNNHLVLNVTEDVKVGGAKAGTLGIGLALVGHAE